MDPGELLALSDALPKVIRLQGGWYDGERVTIREREWPLSWHMPQRRPTLVEMILMGPDPGVSHLPKRPVYDYTDSVNDQGERTYRWIGDC